MYDLIIGYKSSKAVLDTIYKALLNSLASILSNNGRNDDVVKIFSNYINASKTKLPDYLSLIEEVTVLENTRQTRLLMNYFLGVIYDPKKNQRIIFEKAIRYCYTGRGLTDREAKRIWDIKSDLEALGL